MEQLVICYTSGDYDCTCEYYLTLEYKSKEDLALDFEIAIETVIKRLNNQDDLGDSKFEFAGHRLEWAPFVFQRCKERRNKRRHIEYEFVEYEYSPPTFLTLGEWYQSNRIEIHVD